MDGNGRWAEKRHFPRIMGHKSAIKIVRETVEGARELGIEVLTLYAFSTENWQRPVTEVNALMQLFEEYLRKELNNLIQNDIQLRLLGRRDRLPEFVQTPLAEALEKTKSNQGMTLCLAVDYGGRDELVRMTQKIARKVQEGSLDPEAIKEETLCGYLDTKGLPQLDLVIRTSGELRLSNFLLWQAAYAEFYFTELLWPDFSKKELLKAIEVYAMRARRMGKVHAG